MKRPETEWRELIDQMRSSGQTQRSWCEANSINVKTMGNWIRRFKQRPADEESNVFVSAGMISKVSPAPTRQQIRIEIAGCIVTVEDGFDTATLKSVVKVLATL